MPQYFKSKNRHIVIYVTGPVHIALSIQLGQGDDGSLTITKKQAVSNGQYKELDERQIKSGVIDGIGKAIVNLEHAMLLRKLIT